MRWIPEKTTKERKDELFVRLQQIEKELIAVREKLLDRANLSKLPAEEGLWILENEEKSLVIEKEEITKEFENFGD
jgi:hypothetical protein